RRLAWATAQAVLARIAYDPRSMKRLALAFLALAACNTTSSGANQHIGFTPTNCGTLGGCDFDLSVGVGGKVDVTLDSLDGTPTAGLDLASRDPNLLSVTTTADVGGEPAWELTALGRGSADLVAIDSGGGEVDFVPVPMVDVVAVQMDPLTSSIVEGSE